MATVCATATFYAPGRQVVEGAELDSSDPVVKGREHLFTPVDVPVKAAPARKATAAKKAAPK